MTDKLVGCSICNGVVVHSGRAEHRRTCPLTPQGERRLQILLYLLARDHLPFGRLEKLLEDHCQPFPGPGYDAELAFSEGALGDWARRTAAELLEERA